MKDFSLFAKSDFGETDSTMTTPATNNTTSGNISAEYMYTILGVYAVIIIIVFVAVSTILFKRIEGMFRPTRHQGTFGYLPVSQDDVQWTDRLQNVYGNVDELNHVVDIHNDSDRPADDSDYDNISLDPGRTCYDTFENSSDDALPDYENPPSYVPQSFIRSTEE